MADAFIARPFAFHCAADVSITFKLPLLHPFIIEWRQLNAELITLAPLGGCVLKNNYTVNKLWGAIHWITAFFSLTLCLWPLVIEWMRRMSCFFPFRSVASAPLYNGGGDAHLRFMTGALWRNAILPFWLSAATPYALCFKWNSLTSSHKCISNARWIK